MITDILKVSFRLLTCVAMLSLFGCYRKVSRTLSSTDIQSTHSALQKRHTVIVEQLHDTIHVPETRLTSIFDLGDTAWQTVESDNQVLSLQVKDGKGYIFSKTKPRDIPVHISRVVKTTESAVLQETLKVSQTRREKNVQQRTNMYWTGILLFVLVIAVYISRNVLRRYWI